MPLLLLLFFFFFVFLFGQGFLSAALVEKLVVEKLLQPERGERRRQEALTQQASQGKENTHGINPAGQY
jgi:hypothetical protein